MPGSPLWTPSPQAVADANMTAFREAVSSRRGVALPDFASLYRWSVEDPETFWSELWRWCDVRATCRGERTLVDAERMPGARFFPDARLNFAANLLRRDDGGIAVVARGEDGWAQDLSWAALRSLVARFARGLRVAGVVPGDRVVGYLPNRPLAVVAMLAAASVGAVWSSCSPDFGVRGTLDRFEQIEPRVLVTTDAVVYGGRRRGLGERLRGITAGLPTLERIVVAPLGEGAPDLLGRPDARSLEDFLGDDDAGPITFEPLPFDHPLYVLYSSGTTGAPKCIVHGAGGTLLQHLKEHQLHCDLRSGDRVFYYTTCGWMMWNWLVTALASEATIVLWDGSPFQPHAGALFDLVDSVGVTFFGTSAKYIDAIRKEGLTPRESHSLASVRMLASTGSPLAPESFEFVYTDIKPDLCLASISGGTDIISCFALGNPAGPVWSGELQTPGLGMRVEVYDDEGAPLLAEPGELVCTAPFPSMPIGFWGDPEQRRYRAAYFEHYPDVWRHGDWAERTARGGLIIHGRSDAVLNPGGVRIGTAEIYRQVEQLEEVIESLVIGQQWDGDVRVVLFVRLRRGLALDEQLTQRIRQRIRENASPRHVPAKVIQVDDIPRTVSGKITELAVRAVVHGRPVRNREALANPEALELFRDLPALAT